MGLTVSGVVEIGRPLFTGSFTLGNVVAFVRANIDRSLLDNWLNLAELQTKFPTRIHINGSMVSFKGPVAIIRYVTAFKVACTALAGVASAFLAYYSSKGLLALLANRKISVFANLDSKKIEKITMGIAIGAGIIVAGLLYTVAMPNLKPGVYFFA